jgi:purine-nucleoside phosphorylase
METYMLYTLAQRHKQHALSVNTVSDNIVTKQWMTPEQRQTGLDNMVTFVLDSLVP